MIYEIISILLLIDSVIALIICFTPLGDHTIEKNPFIRRYLPLEKGWSLVYFTLAAYIGYLTFNVI